MYYLKKINEYLILNFKIMKYYNCKIALYCFLKDFIFRNNNSKIQKKFYRKKYENIKKFIELKYSEIINKYRQLDYYENNKIKENCNIWMFWWQGINDQTPENVKKCIESVQKYSGKHNVVIITQYNINDYIELPEYYYKRLNDNQMTLTHFSDILRVELLAKYGGIWMDATLILTHKLDDQIYQKSFYTIKHGQFSDFHICKGLWSGFFVAVSEENLMMLFLRDMFREYWKENYFLVCYLLIDVFIAIGYENVEIFKRMIDEVDENNTNVFFIDDFGNDFFDEEKYTKLNTYIYKIHYKRTFKSYINNELTYYGFAIERRGRDK